MITINKFVVLLFMFFLVSTGIYLVFINIGVSNNNLDVQSKQTLQNLNIYNSNNSNPFSSDKQLNYSLTAYSNTDPYSASTKETKGSLTTILSIFGDNKLTAFSSPLIFLKTMLPIPGQAFSWSYSMILSLIGILVFIGFMVAWKSGKWG